MTKREIEGRSRIGEMSCDAAIPRLGVTSSLTRRGK